MLASVGLCTYTAPRLARAEWPRFGRVIHTAPGSQTHSAVAADQAGSEHTIAWDLRDEGGRRVGAGLYFARLEAGHVVRAQQLATTP